MLRGGSEDPAAVEGLELVGVGRDGARVWAAARCMRTAAFGVAGKSEGIATLTVREDSAYSACAVAEAGLSARRWATLDRLEGDRRCSFCAACQEDGE